MSTANAIVSEIERRVWRAKGHDSRCLETLLSCDGVDVVLEAICRTVVDGEKGSLITHQKDAMAAGVNRDSGRIFAAQT